MSLFGYMAGIGMAAQGIGMAFQGYYGMRSAERMRDATIAIAHSEANASTAVTRINADAMGDIAGINAGASLAKDRLMIQGMLFQANTEWLQGMQQLRLNSIFDKRQEGNWKLQLSNDIKGMTLAYNAQIHAENQSHVERKTHMILENEYQRTKARTVTA